MDMFLGTFAWEMDLDISRGCGEGGVFSSRGRAKYVAIECRRLALYFCRPHLPNRVR